MGFAYYKKILEFCKSLFKTVSSSSKDFILIYQLFSELLTVFPNLSYYDKVPK